MTHAYNTSTQEAETGALKVPGQLGPLANCRPAWACTVRSYLRYEGEGESKEINYYRGRCRDDC